MHENPHSVKWKTISENITFQNNYLTLHNNLVELPNKNQINYLKIITRNFSTVLCITNDNKIVLIRQYRYAFDDFSWECPGGLIEDNEDPHECAIREVLEETGYRVLNIEQMLKYHPNALSSAWSFTFIAKVEKYSQQNLDDNEFILVKEFDFDEVDNLITKFEFIHGPSLIAWLNFKATYENN